MFFFFDSNNGGLGPSTGEYVTENGADNYVTEDGANEYVTEN